jgi:hypothetical protein
MNPHRTQIQALSPEEEIIFEENRQLKETVLNFSRTLASYGKITTLQSQMIDALVREDNECLQVLVKAFKAEARELQRHVSCLKTHQSDSSEMDPLDLGCFRHQNNGFNDDRSLNARPNQTELRIQPGNT